MNFVLALCATVRDLSATTMHLDPGKRLKTNERDSGVWVQRDSCLGQVYPDLNCPRNVTNIERLIAHGGRQDISIA